MPDSVLIAFDGSPLSERALAYAIENFTEATLTTRYVINPIDSVIDVEAGGLPVAEDWYDNAQDRATRIHTTATNLAAEHNLDRNTVTEVGRPARAILEYADDHGVDRLLWEVTVAQVSIVRSSDALQRQSPGERGSR